LQGEAAGPDGRVAWIKTNRGVGICLTVFVALLLVYLSQQDWVYTQLRDGFRLGFFSVVSAIAMLICSVALIFDQHRNDSDEEMVASNWRDWIVTLVAVVICYIYFELAWRVDFLLVTPIFLGGAIYLFGIRPARTAVISGVVIAVVIFSLFWLIGITLPSYILNL